MRAGCLKNSVDPSWLPFIQSKLFDQQSLHFHPNPNIIERLKKGREQQDTIKLAHRIRQLFQKTTDVAQLVAWKLHNFGAAETINETRTPLPTQLINWVKRYDLRSFLLWLPWLAIAQQEECLIYNEHVQRLPHFMNANLPTFASLPREAIYEMKVWSSQLWLRFKQPQLSLKNVFGASTGFEPMVSALALQCSTKSAMKTHTLEVGQFIEFIVPVKGMKHEYYVNCGRTNEMKMWSSQLLLRFKQSQIKPEKCFRGLNRIRTHGLCVSTAVLNQLNYEDPYFGSRPIYWVHRTCERNETYQYYGNCRHTNEMKMWSSQLCLRLNNRKLSPKNVFGASSGFEPVASALALQCSTNWVIMMLKLIYWTSLQD